LIEWDIGIVAIQNHLVALLILGQLDELLNHALSESASTEFAVDNDVLDMADPGTIVDELFLDKKGCAARKFSSADPDDRMKPGTAGPEIELRLKLPARHIANDCRLLDEIKESFRKIALFERPKDQSHCGNPTPEKARPDQVLSRGRYGIVAIKRTTPFSDQLSRVVDQIGYYSIHGRETFTQS
jgi:hypothetical protein